MKKTSNGKITVEPDEELKNLMDNALDKKTDKNMDDIELDDSRFDDNWDNDFWDEYLRTETN